MSKFEWNCKDFARVPARILPHYATAVYIIISSLAGGTPLLAGSRKKNPPWLAFGRCFQLSVAEGGRNQRDRGVPPPSLAKKMKTCATVCIFMAFSHENNLFCSLIIPNLLHRRQVRGFGQGGKSGVIFRAPVGEGGGYCFPPLQRGGFLRSNDVFSTLACCFGQGADQRHKGWCHWTCESVSGISCAIGACGRSKNDKKQISNAKIKKKQFPVLNPTFVPYCPGLRSGQSVSARTPNHRSSDTTLIIFEEKWRRYILSFTSPSAGLRLEFEFQFE